MNKNIGKIDKIVRILVGLAIITYGIMEQSWFGILGVIPLLTAIISWCPLYCPLKIKTCEKNNCDL